MRLLPFDYAMRNLARRPVRSLLTAFSIALTAGLVAGTTAFVRGLEAGFAGAATPDLAVLLSSVSERDVLRSTVVAALPGLVAADVRGLKEIGGVPAVSGELHFGTYLRLGGDGENDAAAPLQAFVRGVTDRAFLVHEAATIVRGRVPRTGEVAVGRLAAAKAGAPPEAFELGRKVRFEGATFVVAAEFAAPGTTLESEIWAPVEELKGLTKRDDLSVVFARFKTPDDLEELELFAKRRLDLELVAIPASLYYREAAEHLAPIGNLAWLMAAMIAATALACGAGTLSTSVFDRVRELSVLRAIGYGPFALSISVATESVVLAAAGGLVGVLAARLVLDGAVVGIAMGAFALDPDPVALASGAAAALLTGVFGAVPAAWRAARIPVAVGLKQP